MSRYINPNSDGKFYGARDEVTLACGDCEGCFSCCHDMGESVRLDPYDVAQLQKGLGMGFQDLVQKGLVSILMEDYLLVPYLTMNKDTNCCGFLGADHRCTIHPFRPGICRLFPLGRDYQNGSLSYIYLKDGCQKKAEGKVEVQKWIGVENFSSYEKYLRLWHDFKKEMSGYLAEANEEQQKQMSLYLLDFFYGRAYESDDFYREFDGRIIRIRNLF